MLAAAVAVAGVGLWLGGQYVMDSRSLVHAAVVMPLLRLVLPDAEESHRVAVWLAKHGWCPTEGGAASAPGGQLSLTVNP